MIKKFYLHAPRSFCKGRYRSWIGNWWSYRCLADIKEEDLIENFNFFSVIYGSRVGLQWLMLEPISFVNASYVPNVAYVRLGKVMTCATLKNNKRGEELVVSYHKHFFGP